MHVRFTTYNVARCGTVEFFEKGVLESLPRISDVLLSPIEIIRLLGPSYFFELSKHVHERLKRALPHLSVGFANVAKDTPHFVNHVRQC